MKVKFEITKTTKCPSLLIDDIKNWLKCDADIVKTAENTLIAAGSAALGDMLGFVAQLPQGCVREKKGYNINANNIEIGNTVIAINLDFATKLRRTQSEIIALTLGDEAAQSYNDKAYASADGAW